MAKKGNTQQDAAEAQNAKMSQERAFLTKLLEAALQGDAKKVKENVLEYSRLHKIPIHEILSQFKDGQRRTTLHFACMSEPSSNEENDIVASLLTSNGKEWLIAQKSLEEMVRLKDKDGLTPLMLSARHSNKSSGEIRVKFLLDKFGHKLALARSHAGATALHYAAGAGASAKTIQWLGQAAPVALTTNSKQGGTPLHWAAATRTNCNDTLHALLDCTTTENDILDRPNEQGMPAVILAAAAGNDAHAKLLVMAGAKYDMELPGNVTLFHMAADLNLVGTLAALMEKTRDETLDAKLKKKNAQGETPLDLAAQEGHTGCVMLLLPNGANSENEAKACIENHKSIQQKDQNEKPVVVPEKKTDTEDSSNPQKDEIEARGKHRAEQAQKASLELSAEDKARALELKNQGNACFCQKQYQDAVDKYSAAIDADPTNATLYSNRSACYMAMQQHERALEDAVTCRQLNPTWPKAYFRVSVARYELGRYEDAAVAAWEGLQKDTTNDELKRLLQKCVKQGKKVHQQQSKKDKQDSES